MRISKRLAASLGGGESGLCALGNELALPFGQRRVKMEHKRIGVRAQLGNKERDAVSHELGNEMHVTGEPIELRDGDWAGFP